MTSKFNPLFNGEQAFLEGYTTLTTGHVNKYDEILAVYPFGSAEQAQAVVPQMDRAIEKSVKVIRDHSMNIGGQQKNPYVIESYVLMAKANFFKQDYFKSLEGFNYVLQRYPREEQAIEARLWAGRCNTRIGNEFTARAQFEEIYRNRDVRDRLKPHIYASMAELEISLKNYDAAIELLNEAIEAKPEKEYRIRWRYVLGQLYQKMGLRHEASEAFNKVVRDHPSDYEFYLNAQLQRALNFDVDMGNVNTVYRDLERMASNEKNTEYQDRIFYVMALLALEDDDYPKAEESLKRSVRASVNNNEQKGLSYLKLAEINFEFRQYVPSQAYYDSAYTVLPRTHSRFSDVERFRGSLNDLVQQIRTIETNDSLIRLAGMSPSQQRALFEEYIANLREAEELEAEKERNRELNRQLAAEASAMGSGPQAGLTGGSWYFYGETTRNAGIRDFQDTWGRRELTDNWRQASKARMEGVAANDGSAEETEGADEVASNGPTGDERYNIEAYLAQIPKSQATMDGMHVENQDAYIRMGGIYKDEIEDIREALNTYLEYLERYADGERADLVLYAVHLIYVELGDQAKADEFGNRLKNGYPSSKFTAQLDGTAEEADALLVEAKAEYRVAYELFTSGNASRAKDKAKAGIEKYKQLPFVAKFDLLYALTLAKTEGPAAYATQLKYVSDTYPDTDEAIMANHLLQYADGGAEEVVPTSINYAHDPKTPHRVLVVVPNGQGDMNTLRNAFSDFNRDFNRFQNLQVQSAFLDRNTQLIAITGFTQYSEAKAYIDRAIQNPSISTVYSSEIMRIFAINDANYQTFYRLKDVDEYKTFYDQIR